MPDERINKDTSGRSNLHLVSLLGDGSTSNDRVWDSNILSFANKKKKNERNQPLTLEQSNETSEIASSFTVNNPEANIVPLQMPVNLIEEEINSEFKQVANEILNEHNCSTLIYSKLKK